MHARAEEILLKEVAEALKALKAWRADAYPCPAAPCSCKSKWHMRTGPTAFIERTDKALAKYEAHHD